MALAAGRQSIPALAFMITCYRPGGPQYASQWTPIVSDGFHIEGSAYDARRIDRWTQVPTVRA